MTHSTLHPLRFGLIVAPLLFGCDKLDVGDLDDATTTSGASQSATGNATTDDGSGASMTGEQSTTGGGEAGGTDPTDAGPACDPLLQDCAEGDTCVWDDDVFRCLPADHDGQTGDPCEQSNGCDVGLQCIDPESAGCGPEAAGCCSPFCDLGDPVCPDGMECVAWPGSVAPGFEDVGVCHVGGSGSESESGGSDSSGGGVPSECDGLLQDCIDGDTCVLDGSFVCEPAGELGLDEGCAAPNDCQVGFMCASWDILVDCDPGNGGGCCTPLCDLTAPSCPDADFCREIEGGPYLGNENTGVCAA